MRTEKELLQVLLDNSSIMDAGLCWLIDDLLRQDIISVKEFLVLENYLYNNKPSNILSLTEFWFPMGEKEPRINWLKEQINKLI